MHSQVHRDLGVQFDLDQSAPLALRARSAEERRQGRRDRQLPLAHGEGRRLAHLPKPGTDGALAMGFIDAMIERACRPGLGREAHGRLRPSWPSAPPTSRPTMWRRSPAFRQRTSQRFAREFATIQPSVIRIGVALERHAGGGADHPCGVRHPRARPAHGAMSAAACCRCRSGSSRSIGCVAARFHPPRHARRQQSPARTSADRRDEARSADHGSVRLQHQSCQPGARDQQDREGLYREDLFFVIAEHFVTDTAAYADIMLPADHGGRARGHDVLLGPFLFDPQREGDRPPGEAKSNGEIFRLLAAAFGFEDPQFKMSDSELCRALPQMGRSADGRHRHGLFPQHGYCQLAVGTPDDRLPHANGNFPTPSGKVEFLVKDAKNFVAPPFRMMYEGEQSGEAIDPLPGYMPPRESVAHQSAACQALSAEHDLAEEPRLPQFLLRQRAAQDQGPGRAVRDDHPEGCRQRGIREGDPVRVVKRPRRFRGLARVTDDVHAGMVVATLGYWRELNRSDGSVNSISSDACSGLGHAPTFSDNLVQVTRVN